LPTKQKTNYAPLILTRSSKYLPYWRRLARPRCPYRYHCSTGPLIAEQSIQFKQFMTKLEIKGDLNILKGKLKQKTAKLTGGKLQCVEGMSEELLGRIQKHTSEAREAIKKAAR
jgi:uncharacterized protein YjbJ (UPF0337 family)